MRTNSADIIAAQKASSSIPYISISLTRSGDSTYTFTTADSPNRIRLVRHIEEPFGEEATILLENSNRNLATDLCGYKCAISYGYVIDGTPDVTGGGSAPLWIKKVFNTSKMGSLDAVLFCQGAWIMLSEIEDIASLINSGDPGSAPYYQVDYSGSSKSVYDCIEDVLDAAGYDTKALGSDQFADDGILDTLEPAFAVNTVSFESASQIIYRFLLESKSFLRNEVPAGADLADFRVIYPGGYAAFDDTFTSDGA